MVDLPPGAVMQGRSLLPPRVEDRPVHAIALENRFLRTLVIGQRTLILSDARHELYDSRADPDETTNLMLDAGPPPAWNADMLDALSALEADFAALRARIGEPGESEAFTPEALEELRALGYVGDDGQADRRPHPHRRCRGLR
jgi:hypothetical protein